MDYYSNFPAPSYEECKHKLVTELYNSVTIQELAEKQIINVYDIVEQAFFLSDMLDSKDWVLMAQWNSVSGSSTTPANINNQNEKIEKNILVVNN